MSDTCRNESRRDWLASATPATTSDVQLGCFQRIADACELMAKRHDELVRARESAESNARHYQDLYRQTVRSLNAMRGQTTKLKKRLAIGAAS